MLIWKIAWRNLRRHTGKSVVIGVILFVGALVMTVGNAVIEGSKQGLEENLVHRFTGHLILASADEDTQGVFTTRKSLQVLPDFLAIKDDLENEPLFEHVLPMTRGMALILNEEGQPEETLIFGVNFEAYQDTFLHNIALVEGDFLQNGERGVLLSDTSRERLYDRQKFWVVPQNSPVIEDNLPPAARFEGKALDIRTELVFMGFSQDAFEADIRLPVKGIVRFEQLNALWGGISFMDIESFRECFGYITAADNAVDLSEREQAILSLENTDDVFAEADLFADMETSAEQYDVEAMQQETDRSEVEINLDNGAYNLASITLKPGVSLKGAMDRLRSIVAAANANIKVLTWKEAAGEVAQFAAITQQALSVFVFFLFFVAIIIMMNTLSMAALERTSEIGMMRAVGAQKGFISRMFYAETALLALVFGGLGIVVGAAAVAILGALQIPAIQNEFWSLMVGGNTFHPLVSLSGIGTGVVQLAVVTVLAMLYPVFIARKISPLDAISRD